MFNRRPSLRIVLLCLVTTLAISACLGGSGGHSRTASRPGAFDDAVLTTRVKTAFINDPVVGGSRIDVDTVNGVVTLSGRVPTKEQEAKAIQLARAVKGVIDVRSSLLIQP
jgi:hyperosmotically inducible periplasmic protein